ncbi:DegV family protein [Lachnospiraceae bacterium 46-61]
MHNYKLFSDSSCDLPAFYVEKYDIGIVPYTVSFGDETYYKEISELQPHDFYEKIVSQNIFPKTSLPSIQDYIDAFTPTLQSGKDIICICLSSKFSGSFQSANNAKNILLESYPNSNIAIIDSRQATGGQGLLLYEMAQMQCAGYEFEKVVSKAERLRDTAKINFTVESLDYLQKGGRIGKASALAGTILNIKPIIIMANGELSPVGKVRGFKKSVKTIIDMTQNEIGEELENYQICVLSAQNMDRAEELKNLLKQNDCYDILEIPFQVGVTIGAHAGPTALGICYIKKYNCI